MNDLLDVLHRVLRYSHIGVGGVGLLLFWLPVFAKKGGWMHIAGGRVFTWTAYWVTATALVSSAWGLVDPDSFLGLRNRATDPARLAAIRENVRFIFAILGYLAMVVLSSTYCGVRVIRTRRDHAQLRAPLLMALEGGALLSAVALALFGGMTLALSFVGRSSLPPEEAAKYWVPTLLGAFGALGVREDLKYILRPPPTPMAWWYKHMELMLGVGIAYHTAFLVFGVQRLTTIQVQGVWRLAPWILPSLIGVPLIQVWVRSYKRKFCELPAALDNARSGVSAQA